MKTRWKAVFRFYACHRSLFFWGTKSSHSDLPKGTNEYLLKEIFGVAVLEKFWSDLTFAWLQWRSLQGIQVSLWLSWWFHPQPLVFCFFSGGALPCSADEEAFDLMGTWGVDSWNWLIYPPWNKHQKHLKNGWLEIDPASFSGWWFQRFFMFIPTWGRFPFWLIFFKWVEITN